MTVIPLFLTAEHSLSRRLSGGFLLFVCAFPLPDQLLRL